MYQLKINNGQREKNGSGTGLEGAMERKEITW